MEKPGRRAKQGKVSNLGRTTCADLTMKLDRGKARTSEWAERGAPVIDALLSFQRGEDRVRNEGGRVGANAQNIP